jgi:hypothetical protein
MLSRIVIVGVLILAVMVAVQQGALRQVGLTGSCRQVEVLADDSTWVTCSPGKLSGRPTLGGNSCTSAGVRGTVEWWHCPASVTSSAIGR